ncbi:Flp family type IVb pilin [Hyphomonas sp.]|jgi:pilus assembly protein Flp/PilA|uniref:Flp family type IVb pilin n=2 Tax=Hyphomonas sp. TaxID=87 RepID=UPI0025C36490|nr:Flp family type IVb pilin [Hyphomonas sp.]
MDKKMNAMRCLLKDLLADEGGATAVEYGMIAALIVVALLSGLTSVAAANDETYQQIEDAIVT